jgi:hypothetical protein
VLCRRLWKQYYSRWQLHVQGFEQNAMIIFTKRNNDSPSGMRQFLKNRGAIGTVGRVREISPDDRQSFYYTCQENPHRYLVS